MKARTALTIAALLVLATAVAVGAAIAMTEYGGDGARPSKRSKSETCDPVWDDGCSPSGV